MTITITATVNLSDDEANDLWNSQSEGEADILPEGQHLADWAAEHFKATLRSTWQYDSHVDPKVNASAVITTDVMEG